MSIHDRLRRLEAAQRQRPPAAEAPPETYHQWLAWCRLRTEEQAIAELYRLYSQQRLAGPRHEATPPADEAAKDQAIRDLDDDELIARFADWAERDLRRRGFPEIFVRWMRLRDTSQINVWDVPPPKILFFRGEDEGCGGKNMSPRWARLL